MTADQRVQIAREYLAGARKRKVGELPPSLLIRECAEMRRLLGQVLDVVDEAALLAADDSTGTWLDGSATVAPADLATVLDALHVAADHKRDLAAHCSECEIRPEGLCPTCETRLDRADEYGKLAQLLGGSR